jgi:hypothetical protein
MSRVFYLGRVCVCVCVCVCACVCEVGSGVGANLLPVFSSRPCTVCCRLTAA